ncbi:1432_t:CDS:1 [Cetraspora pellucida]|uniref:1432_t:CDS:1 n=1 Tax=Cetraspora pellucida TaxID=1433469 RepID=A0A9N9HF83_9GLOM|nr:1432_t:CDS:1 [Cetraspora pellucida]
MPYVAPEVLKGQQFTQAADIYSLGVIMSEISTGKKAFDGVPFNTTLFLKICNKNERPELGEGTPECYVQLAKRCMDSDPNERPTTTIISSRIVYWLDEIEQKNDNEIKKQFLEADNIVPKVETSIHPSYMYTRKLINTKRIDETLINS